MSGANSRRRRGSEHQLNDDVEGSPRAGASSSLRLPPRSMRVLALFSGLAVLLMFLAMINKRIVTSLFLEVDDDSKVRLASEARNGLFENWIRSLRGYVPEQQQTNIEGIKDKYRSPEPVMILKDQIRAMDAKNRSGLLEDMLRGKVLLNPTPTRLHGFVGLQDDGLDIWTPVELSVPADKLDIVKELRVGGGFNIKLSDSLPLDRDVEDNRHAECKKDWDLKMLPRASVVIIFHNEPRSTLWRSIHSIYNYTPPDLLHEIILVDDGSNLSWIVDELDSMVARYPKMKLLRLKTRSGIVGARMAGIEMCEAPIFIVLDSHIEVQPMWLEPLVARIGADRTAVVMPQVDSLEAATFKYGKSGIGCTLGFLWKMIEHGYTPSKALKSPADRVNRQPNDPISSPTMAGGLFGASKEFFLNDLGGYDTGFQYWGTENLELSFRLWQCGGRLECIPCSRVYHVFREGGVGYTSPRDSTTKNKIRLISVWMDEYADLAWKTLGEPEGLDYGDLSAVILWRKERQCKSFRWYLENIYPEAEVIDISKDVPYLGFLRVDSSFCLYNSDPDDPAIGQIKLISCTSANNRNSRFTYFSRSKRIQPVTNDESCLNTKNPSTSSWCEHSDTMWLIVPLKPLNDDSASKHEETLQIKKPASNQCLAADDKRVGVILKKCDATDISQVRKRVCTHYHDNYQVWIWPKYTPPKIWTPAPRGNK